MATEKDANKARKVHEKMLHSLGVHSIGVDEIGKKGSRNFAVIAFVDRKSKALPKELIISSGKKKIVVPLIAKYIERFKAE